MGITRNKDKTIVPSSVKQFDFLLKNVDVHFYLVTDRKELTKIAWEGASKHPDVVNKWKERMTVVYYDGSDALENNKSKYSLQKKKKKIPRKKKKKKKKKS